MLRICKQTLQNLKITSHLFFVAGSNTHHVCSMNRPELIVFDLAGTVIDNKNVYRVLYRLFKKIHIRISLESVNKLIGIPKMEAIKMLLQQYRYPYISEMLVLEMHHHFVQKMKDVYLKNPSVREKDSVSDLFQVCKQYGIKVVVETEFDCSIAVLLLKRMGWDEKAFIDAIITYDNAVTNRPHPYMIYRAMEMTGTTAVENVAKVGDTIFDLQEGTSAGCGWVVGVTSGAHTRDQLKNGPHTHLIDQLSELKPIFNL